MANGVERSLLPEESSSLGSVTCDRWPLVAWLSVVQSASVGHPSERGRTRLAALVGASSVNPGRKSACSARTAPIPLSMLRLRIRTSPIPRAPSRLEADAHRADENIQPGQLLRLFEACLSGKEKANIAPHYWIWPQRRGSSMKTVQD